MLKTNMSLQMLATNKLLGARVLTANEVGDVEGSNRSKYMKSKTGRLESQKSAKSQKLPKSGKSKDEKSKKPSKSGNSPNFNIKNSGPSFLTLKTRSAVNCLPLAFTKAPVLQHFDPKCHIWIKTDALGYVIGGMLSQLAFGTRLDKIITKTDLDHWHPVAFFQKKWFQRKYDTRSTTVSFWLLSKSSRYDVMIWKVASMRFSSLRTTITFVIS